MVFDIWGRKFWTFSKKFSANLSLLHSMHPESLSEMKGFFLFSLIEQIFRKFCSSFGRKIQKFGGNISTGLLILQLRSSCRERNLNLKNSWKLFFSFYGSWAERFCTSSKMFSRDVRNAFHVSRIPFRENFFIGEINLLMDNSANCAVDIRFLVRTSQHGCQIYSLVVRRDI